MREIRQHVELVACNSEGFQAHQMFHGGWNAPDFVVAEVKFGELGKMVEILNGADAVVCKV